MEFANARAVRVLVFLLLTIVLAAGVRVSADTVDVDIRNFAFDPEVITIPSGTTVRWTNFDGSAHTSTSSAGLWNSGTMSTGETFYFTFTTVGSFDYFCAIHPIMTGTVQVTVATDVEDESKPTTPNEFWLGANYPNPFNPSTTIEYSLATRAHVTVTVYNVVGQVVRTLVDASQSAGLHTTTWDGTDAEGRAMPSGIYFYHLQADDFSQTRKMMLMK